MRHPYVDTRKPPAHAEGFFVDLRPIKWMLCLWWKHFHSSWWSWPFFTARTTLPLLLFCPLVDTLWISFSLFIIRLVMNLFCPLLCLAPSVVHFCHEAKKNYICECHMHLVAILTPPSLLRLGLRSSQTGGQDLSAHVSVVWEQRKTWPGPLGEGRIGGWCSITHCWTLQHSQFWGARLCSLSSVILMILRYCCTKSSCSGRPWKFLKQQMCNCILRSAQADFRGHIVFLEELLSDPDHRIESNGQVGSCVIGVRPHVHLFGADDSIYDVTIVHLKLRKVLYWVLTSNWDNCTTWRNPSRTTN